VLRFIASVEDSVKEPGGADWTVVNMPEAESVVNVRCRRDSNFTGIKTVALRSSSYK
jgi:hypothetical protein